jgi:ribonuclease III
LEITNAPLDQLQAQIGIAFQQPTLLLEAMTHSSFVNELPDTTWTDNQRLEFLGDAILDFLVGEWLFRRYTDAPEGELTGLRAHIVRTEGLALFARELGLGRFLRLGRGEDASGGRERTANLCAGFEALVGALYLDQGIEVTRHYVQDRLNAHAEEIDSQRAAKDAKSRLQELTQSSSRVTPIYRIVREEGPDHAKVFTAQVLLSGELWGQGMGTSKQAAEQAAAADALRRHRGPQAN